MPNHILRIFGEQEPEVEYTLREGYAHLDDALLTNAGTPDWQKLAVRYGTGKNGGVYIGFDDLGNPRADNSPPWQEINFATQDPTIKESVVAVAGQRLDSYTIQAIRRRKVDGRGLIENAVQGFLVRDGYFLLGVRGGQDQPGTLNVLPGGSVSWKDEYQFNPFHDAMADEVQEEAGTSITGAKLVGIFNQVTAHINRQWFYIARPSATLDSIIENVHQGIELYRQVKKKTGDEAVARKALWASSYPTDSWENSSIVKLPYDPETFLRLLSNGKMMVEERDCKLIGSLPADLYIAGVLLAGNDFRREAASFKLVKDDIVFSNLKL